MTSTPLSSEISAALTLRKEEAMVPRHRARRLAHPFNWLPSLTECRHDARAAVARSLWDEHYAEMIQRCAPRGDFATAQTIVSEAFVRLLCCWLPPRDALAFVEKQLDQLTSTRCRK